MKVVENKAILLSTQHDIINACKVAEYGGRLSHDSIDKIGPETYKDFLLKMINLGHTSVLEHINISFLFQTSRSCSHELIRHRHIAVTEKSTRYCNYANLEIVLEETDSICSPMMYEQIAKTEEVYKVMSEWFEDPDLMREVLPNCTATKLVVTTNLREWLHIIKLRKTKHAHPVIRDLANQIEDQIKALIPWLWQRGEEDD